MSVLFTAIKALGLDHEDAIREIALDFFRENGTRESLAEHLTDYIYGALGEVEQQEAFVRLSGAVERAFNRLRVNGYRCEQDWQCCMTCGWDAIPWEDAGNCVWYHGQDREDGFRTGKLFLVWQGDVGLIRECLEAEGLKVEHDGTVGQRIKVTLSATAKEQLTHEIA
jgi:hypothetical protein